MLYQKAKEIQKAWEPRIGDIADWSKAGMDDRKRFWEQRLVVPQSLNIVVVIQDSPKLKKLIWRPNQEQLQKLIFHEWHQKDIVANINEFNTWCKKNWIYGSSTKGGYFKSVNELWLAFAMDKLHNKTWNGKRYADTDAAEEYKPDTSP